MWQEPGVPLMMICAQAQTERQEGCLDDEGDSFCKGRCVSFKFTSFLCGHAERSQIWWLWLIFVFTAVYEWVVSTLVHWWWRIHLNLFAQISPSNKRALWGVPGDLLAFSPSWFSSCLPKPTLFDFQPCLIWRTLRSYQVLTFPSWPGSRGNKNMTDNQLPWAHCGIGFRWF